MSPSRTKRQRKMMGADLARKRAGEPTKTGMSEQQLEEFVKGAGPRPKAKKKR